MRLYELAAEYKELMTAIENGEIPEEAITDTLEGMSGILDEKIDNIACIIKDYKGDIEKMAAEEKALAKRRKQIEKAKEWLEGYISNALLAIGKKEFTTARNKITFKPSKGVVFDDETKFVEWAQKNRKDLLTITETVKANRTAIKEAIDNGETIDGCNLENRMNIQVR